MKKIFTKLMLLAVAAAALVSCVNKFDESTPFVELTQTVTLSAEKPTEVRTELIGGVPYWSKGDQIGVYVVDGDGYKNYAFKNDSEEETSFTTTFTGTTAVVNTLYVYYPYTNFSTPVTEKGVKVEILANQEPTAASFDGRTDLMIAKPVTLDEEGKQLSDLEFARVAAIVKIVLKDKTGNLAGQHVSSLTMKAENNLVGRVYLDVINQELGELYNGGAKSVNATYTEATQYEVNGTNATYLIVYPQTLESGSTLSFEASTEGYAISKEITLPSDIELLAGKVTTLNVSLAADNLVKEETGLALPFEDDFSWVGKTSTNAFTSVTDIFPTRDGAAMYTAVATVYSEDNTALKFSSGSAAGSLTTAAIDLSQPFSVVVNAKYHGSDASSLVITVGEVTETIALTADYADYVVEFDAASAKETITISGTAKSKRFYLNDFKVVAGHDYVLPPVLTVSTAEISGVSHEGEAKTFTYSVTNPAEGVSATVTDNVDWIETADNNGTVTVTVAENTLEEAREGVVTVTYGDLTKTVTVKQNAKPTAGGPTTFVDVLNLALTGMSGTTYGTWSGKTSNSTAVYAGNSAGGNSSIQLRSNNSNSGIVTTKSGGKVRSITIAWNSSTGNNKTLDVYGKSSAYSAATDLYGNNKGTKIGTLTKGQSNTLTITGDYEYIGMRSTSGAIYIDQLEITWESGEGGGSTPEPEPATPVLSVNPTTLSFDAAAASKTVTCTIENEVSGVNVTATESVDWLSTSVSGKTVTVTATANTATTTRTATVTIAYTGAESKTVTVNQAAAEVVEPEQPGGGETTTKTYTFTITKSDFTTKSYADNNKEHTSTATATDGTTMQVKWTSNQVYQNGDMQWQKSNGYIYNSTDLGTINSVTVETVSGSFTKYINSTKQPTSNGSGGYFQVKTGSSAVGHTNSITVTFTK